MTESTSRPTLAGINLLAVCNNDQEAADHVERFVGMIDDLAAEHACKEVSSLLWVEAAVRKVPSRRDRPKRHRRAALRYMLRQETPWWCSPAEFSDPTKA